MKKEKQTEDFLLVTLIGGTSLYPIIALNEIPTQNMMFNYVELFDTIIIHLN